MCWQLGKRDHNGPIKLNLEFRFSSNFNFNLRISQQLLIVILWFSNLSNLGIWTFFSVNYCSSAQQTRIRVFKFGFQNPGFQFQFLTQPDISFQGFQILNPKKTIFWFILIGLVSHYFNLDYQFSYKNSTIVITFVFLRRLWFSDMEKTNIVDEKFDYQRKLVTWAWGDQG